jgi:hypothetical protein
MFAAPTEYPGWEEKLACQGGSTNKWLPLLHGVETLVHLNEGRGHILIDQCTRSPLFLSYIGVGLQQSTCFANTLQNTIEPNNKAIIFVPKRMCLFLVTMAVEAE